MEKAQARDEIRRRITAITQAERAAKSSSIKERLLALSEFANADVVMLFVAMDDETDTLPIIDAALEAGKTVVLPKVNNARKIMTACPVSNSSSDLARGVFGILEPVSDVAIDPSRIDFCLVPARGFDLNGNRLGRGGGYYDRFMSGDGFRAVRCGIVFDVQILDDLPREDHDLPVQIIVTESRVIRP